MLTNFKDNIYKDKQVYETLDNMRNVIDSLGFDVIEEWCDSGVGTYSHKLNLMLDEQCIKSTYGKGNTPEFSLASAYGEMLEELQCAPSLTYKQFHSMYDKDLLGLHDFVVYPDEKKEYDLDKYLATDEYIKYLKKTYTAEIVKEDIESFVNTQHKSYGYIPLPEFTDAITGEKVYTNEMFIREKGLGTTGLAAGNSKYEALLHGICETLERYVKQKIYINKLCIPIVPEEYLKQYTRFYEIYKSICMSGRYTIEVRDASLGGKFPVVCVVIYDRDRRGYATSFGCFPAFEVALDRTINELLQWTRVNNIRGIVEMDPYEVMRGLYSKNNIGRKDIELDMIFDLRNLTDSNTSNTGYFHDGFFTERQDFRCVLWGQDVNKTNEEMFNELCQVVDDVTDERILYKEYSFLGVPAYSLIFTAMAAEIPYGLNGHYVSNKFDRGGLEKAIYGSKELDKEELLNIYETEDCYAKLDRILGRPLKYYNLGEDFYKGYMEFVKGNYTESAEYIRTNMPKLDTDNEDELFENLDKWRILVNYIGMLDSIGNRDEIENILGKMYDIKLVSTIGDYCIDHNVLGNAMFKDPNSLICVVDWDMCRASARALGLLRDRIKKNTEEF